MKLLKRIEDPNLDLREKVERSILHVAALSELAHGVRYETFDSLHSRVADAKIHLSTPESDVIADGQVVYNNHASALVHWHFPDHGASDWMEVSDACLTYTLLRGVVRMHHMDGMLELHSGQSVRMPSGTKFRFEWDTETFAQVLYQRNDACPCRQDCSIVRTGPDVQIYARL